MTTAPLNFATFLGLPTSIVGIGTIIVFIFLGIFYVIGLFNNARDKQQKISDDKAIAAENATTFVITALKEQISVLEKKVQDQSSQINDMALRLESLSGENKSLKDLLLGKDDETKKFQAMGVEVMTKVVPQLMNTTRETNLNVTKLYRAIEKHLAVIEKGRIVTVTTGPAETSIK